MTGCLPSTRAADLILKIRFGLDDKTPMDWSGSVQVSDGGVVSLEGMRFAGDDAVLDGNRWKAQTRPAATPNPRSNNAAKAATLKKELPEPILDNGVSVELAGVEEDSTISVKTAQGDFSFGLSEAPFGRVFEAIEGAVEVRRLPAAHGLTSGGPDDDSPAVAVGADGAVYVAYVSFTPGLDRSDRLMPFTESPDDFAFLSKPAGGDQVWLRRGMGGVWEEPVAITHQGRDVFRCAAAVDGSGSVWVIWSERGDGNFDLHARAIFSNGTLSEPARLTTTPGNDINPVAAVDGNGRVWAAWQGADDGRFHIFEAHQTSDGEWSEPRRVSTQEVGNCWMPAISGDSRQGGGVAIAWDTYAEGDYDVWGRRIKSDGTLGKAGPVAAGPEFETGASLAFDTGGRLWVAWEIGGPMWAKDYGTDPLGGGIPLDLDRQVGMRVLEDGKWMEAPAGYRDALPVKGEVRQFLASSPEEQVGLAHMRVPETGGVFNKLGNIACDSEGRIWLFVRNRAGGAFANCVGRFWTNAACYFDGESWVGPISLPHSGDTSHKRPALAAAPGGGILFAQSSDHRDERKFDCKPAFSLAFGGFPYGADFEGQAVADVFDTDIYAGIIAPPGEAEPFGLDPGESPPVVKAPAEATREERQAVARCRDYRIDYNGAELQILRGEFHRHTEISTCSIVDGTLEDMWRYALDAAAMDWIGNGDHDNGGGREYPWWLTQKMTDAYHLPGHFDPLFSYERSYNWPEGHRNVLFTRRGVRTLPRLVRADPEPFAPSEDTEMLYRYLHQHGGICAAHTSATSMGTDWRSNDPVVEPMVEVYQGCRQNYERPEAPRAPAPEIAQPYAKGFVNEALKMGYKFAFEASSDHFSTHISYCLVYAGEQSRQGIFDGMKARHVYGATDNIVADYRCTSGGREYMLGDEFSAAEAPELRLRLIGTAPFVKVTLIKDDEVMEVWEPGEAEVELTWTDPNPEMGRTSYYYFRGEQENAELVWVSPMWITYTP